MAVQQAFGRGLVTARELEEEAARRNRPGRKRAIEALLSAKEAA